MIIDFQVHPLSRILLPMVNFGKHVTALPYQCGRIILFAKINFGNRQNNGYFEKKLQIIIFPIFKKNRFHKFCDFLKQLNFY